MEFILIILIPFAALLTAIWCAYIPDVRIANLEKRLSNAESKLQFQQTTALAQSLSTTATINHDATIALLGIQQQHMSRCQNEQVWAIAGYLALTSYVISIRKPILSVIGNFGLIIFFIALAVLTGIFIWMRIFDYYRHHHTRATLANQLPGCPEYLRAKHGMNQESAIEEHIHGLQSAFWQTIFLILLVLPLLALSAHLLAELKAEPKGPAHVVCGLGED